MRTLYQAHVEQAQAAATEELPERIQIQNQIEDLQSKITDFRARKKPIPLMLTQKLEKLRDRLGGLLPEAAEGTGKTTVIQELTKIVRSLEEIRDRLVECSREFVSSEVAEWNTAEALFSLAKSTDHLRQQAKAHLDGQAQRFLPAKDLKQTWTAAPETKSPGRKKRSDYPRYVIRSDCLLKIGLSRDKRTEYEHEVPKAQFNEIIGRLAIIGKMKSEFTVDDLQEGLSCPSYQTYIVVALCLQNQVLESPWRGTYTFPAKTDISQAANRLWNQLPIVQPSGSRDAVLQNESTPL